MSADPALHLLLVEDDQENLDLLEESLPRSLEGFDLRWEPCPDIDDAVTRVSERRYDIVVTDIYRDRTSEKKDPVTGDPRASQIVARIRERRFTPVLLFTDGVFPDGDLTEGPFIKMADKSSGNDQIVEKLRELIATGVPSIAHRLHDELDRSGGSYLWDFLESRWPSLVEAGMTAPDVLERLVRRRAALQIGRLDPSSSSIMELDRVEGAEFYILPSIAVNELRLGEILQRGENEFRVILTPHCHLAVQPGASAPKANFVLTAKTVSAKDISTAEPLRSNSDEKRLKELGSRLQSPANIGVPRGRYWFLPGILNMPHLYVDLLQIESIPTTSVMEEFKSFAVLDTPFAEALQASFVRFYSAVGLPSVKPEQFRDLL
jgi:CheY-like chemotaxis protein